MEIAGLPPLVDVNDEVSPWCGRLASRVNKFRVAVNFNLKQRLILAIIENARTVPDHSAWIKNRLVLTHDLVSNRKEVAIGVETFSVEVDDTEIVNDELACVDVSVVGSL